MKEIKKCEVCGISEEIKNVRMFRGKMLCPKHKKQLYEYGKFIDTTQRTTRDKNEIITYDDYAEMIIRNKRNEYIATILIDKDDIDRILKYKWNVTILPNRVTYPNARINGKTVKLHRYILNYYGDKPIDHKNRNIFDNRKSNLRITSNAINSQNRTLKKNNIYHDANNTWRVEIVRFGIKYHKGYIKTKEEAEKIRDEILNKISKELKDVS